MQARLKAEEVIDLLHLQHYRDTMVAGLPYGVRKVVELARALCTEPRLLLLDEPSSGLNVEETDDMAFWIQDIQQELGITVLMVEHDMSLVSKVSDRVLAMNQGEVLAMGTPREVQTNPPSSRPTWAPWTTSLRCGGPHEHADRPQRRCPGAHAPAAERRKRLWPHQGHPGREPESAQGRNRHRAGLNGQANPPS